MKAAQHAAAIRAALKKASAAEAEAARITSEFEAKTERKNELESLEEPNQKQLDELLRLDRELPFFISRLEKAGAALSAEADELVKAMEASWEALELEVSAQEASETAKAAQAVLPWCKSMEQALAAVESLPRINELNHKVRVLHRELNEPDNDVEPVAEQIIALLEWAKKTK